MTEFDLAEFSKALEALATGAAPAVASFSTHHGRTRSAFHWREGHFVAAESAVEADEAVDLTLADGSTVQAAFVGRDPTSGIALLKIDRAGLPTLEASAGVSAASLVLVAGRSGGSSLAASGLVNEAGPAWRSMRGGLIDRRIGLSVAIDGRFEGGPVLDSSGGLVGMALFGPRRRVLVIPAETIDRVAGMLRDKGRVARGYLGAGLHPVRHAGLAGAMVMSLDENGPAQAAGIQLGDIVTHWNGDAVRGPREVMARLSPDSVGAAATLTLRRGGADTTAAVTIGERPAA